MKAALRIVALAALAFPWLSVAAVYSSSPSRKALDGIKQTERPAAEEALAQDLRAGKFGFREILVIQRHAMPLSHVYTYHVEGFRRGGGIYVFTPGPDGGKLRQLVDSTAGMVLDCDLSYDGREVVFSWKRGGPQMAQPIFSDQDVDRSNPDHNYQIYRMNIDGSGLTALTHAPCNNLNACWLPDGGIAFISDRKPAYAYCWVTTSPVLYRMDRDGRNQKRLSANYLMDFTPSVLNDGRIIYTRWEYVDRPACPIQSLWTINPDGTGLAGFYGNRVISPGTFMQAQPVPGTQQVLALATNHNGDCRGAICLIDHSKGANARQSVRNLTPEVNMYEVRAVYGNGLEGPYETPFPIDNGHFLVSRQGVLELRDFDGDRVSLLQPSQGMGFYSPQPVRAVPTPPIVSGAPLDESVKLAEDGSVSGSWATVVLQDVYQGLAPHVKRGEVRQVCVVQEIEKSVHAPQLRKTANGYENIAAFGYQFPLVSCGATYSPKKVWGFADVAEDGSACFKVPSEVPIYFLALDAEGRAVQRMRTFTHLMPGEVQGCVGCHADRNGISPGPGGLLTGATRPQELRAPEWGVKGFSYTEVVQPVLDKHCTGCHNAGQRPGDVDLSADRTDFFNVSYDVLARKGTLGEHSPQINNARLDSGEEGRSPYTSWIWTINGTERNILQIRPKQWGSPASKLADLVLSGHPDATGKPQVALSSAERRRIFLWIDLNVPYYGTSASNHPDRQGCRRMLPPQLKPVLQEVAARRCASCHASGVPRTFYTRMLDPERNDFLLAPLAKSAGGTEACGRAIFASREDPDYRKILDTFRPIQELLRAKPRPDTDGYVEPPCRTREVRNMGIEASNDRYLLAQGPQAAAPTSDHLRDLAGPFLIGYASASDFERFSDADRYKDVARREFNVLTPENALKWDTIHPQQTVFNFAPGDQHVRFARANNMQVHGHTLVWHNQLPGWLTNGRWNEATLTEVLKDHIDNVAGHYRGQVLVWDVVNEAFNEDGSFRASLWLKTLGEKHLEMAFRRAHAVDPKAKLIYNDYGIETVNKKSSAVFKMISDFKRRGVPIDGVGLQMHISSGGIDVASFANNMQRFADLGVEIYVTEMDVSLALPVSANKLEAQAGIYRDVLHRCLAQPACKGLLMWGFTDRYSWIPQFVPGHGDALIFDADYQPKPAYRALQAELKANPRP